MLVSQQFLTFQVMNPMTKINRFNGHQVPDSTVFAEVGWCEYDCAAYHLDPWDTNPQAPSSLLVYT